MDPCHAVPPEVFFSAAEGVVVPLLLSLNPDRSHARAITFQLAEVAVTGPMVRAILAAIRRLRAPPSYA